MSTRSLIPPRSAPRLVRDFVRRIASLSCDVRYRAAELIAHLQGDAIRESAASAPLDEERRAGVAGTRLARARALLRKHPYWPAGHVVAGDCAIELGDLRLAHASALAALAVAARPPTRARGRAILGKAELRAGNPALAIGTLESALRDADRATTAEILEELGAAHIALGNSGRALEVLDRIDESRRTAAARAMLEFCRRGATRGA